jgi:cell division control protein 6
LSRVNEIFRRAKQGATLFKDRGVLGPDYIPTSLPHRDAQANEVAEKLKPILSGGKPSNLLLYGKTGTGKTAVARYVLKELQAEAGKRKVVVAYVNTRIADTEYRALAEFSEALDLPEDQRIPFTGLATAEVIKRIFNHIKSNAIPTILVMDEVDHLVRRAEGADILYQFTRSGFFRWWECLTT